MNKIFGSRKIVAGVLGIVGASVMVGGIVSTAKNVDGLKAQMVDTQISKPSGVIQTGTVRISGTSGNYTTAITGLMPGDSNAQVRYMDVINGGSLPVGKIDLKITSTGNLVNNPIGSTAPIASGVLNPDGTQQTYTPTWSAPAELKVEYCSVPWNAGNCNGAYQLRQNFASMQGTKIITAFDTVKGSNNPPDIAAVNGKGYIKLTTRLPVTAGPEYQNKTASMNIGLTLTQRKGRNIM